MLNTTHNRPLQDVDDIEVALVKQGLLPEYLHADCHTIYPDVDRAAAVNDWLGHHPEVSTWIALDDVMFTGDERLIFVDSDAGLHFGHLREAIERLGGEQVLILI